MSEDKPANEGLIPEPPTAQVTVTVRRADGTVERHETKPPVHEDEGE